MAYSKTTLKSNGDIASPCSRPFRRENGYHRLFSCGLYYGFHLKIFQLAELIY
jgi:hypothetical protein